MLKNQHLTGQTVQNEQFQTTFLSIVMLTYHGKCRQDGTWGEQRDGTNYQNRINEDCIGEERVGKSIRMR